MSLSRTFAGIIQADGDIKANNLDNISNVVFPIISVYANIEALPTSGIAAGTEAYVTANNKKYIWNGSAWYSIVLTNQNMTYDSNPPSAYTITDSATPLIVTTLVTDPEGFAITYGGTAVDSAQYLMTITRDSSVYTFTPLPTLSVDSYAAEGLIGSPVLNTVRYTFTANDGINTLSAPIDITFDYN